MESKTHVKVQDLTVWYDRQPGLNNISVDIPDKKITAILGPSGCGKTTLLKSLNRLIDLHDEIKVDGSVLVDEEDIYGQKVEVTHLRKKMGLLSQKPQVLPMSIYENVAYGPKIHGLKDKTSLDDLVKKYLGDAGLWNEVKNRLHSPAARLSIGQQQRLCLARGLAVEPEVILGDEPTAALDPISADIIERKFLELKKDYTIILVTHSLRQAKRLADYVIFLYLGNLIECGSAADVFNKPRYQKTKAYIEGSFIEELKIDQELNLRGLSFPDNLEKAKLTLAELTTGQILKIIVDHYPGREEAHRFLEEEGHKILEIKRQNRTNWEIIIQKQIVGYAI